MVKHLKKMRGLRKALKISQEDLALTTGLPLYFIRSVERMGIPIQDADVFRNGLLAIADTLNVDPADLFPSHYLYNIQQQLMPGDLPLFFLRDVSIDAIPPMESELQSPPPDEELAAKWLQDDIQQCLSALPENERRILEMRYGVGERHPWLLDEIAKRHNITRERAHTLADMALSRLRNPIIKQLLRVYLYEQ